MSPNRSSTRRSQPSVLNPRVEMPSPRGGSRARGQVQPARHRRRRAARLAQARVTNEQGSHVNTIEPAVEHEAMTPAAEPSEPVISVRGLSKRYRELEAIREIDLEVRRGEIFAFLGPNGAGKTTTVEILEGFRDRSAGEVSVLGADPADTNGSWRNRVGVVLQDSQPEPGLTVRECLQLYAGYYDRPREIEETIALVGLGEKADTLGEQLSGGQRRRLESPMAR
jgi:ABC-type glutathione transport system ATPase component